MRLIALVVLLFALPARADTVALLPLDGDKKLEIYGQPVAAELGRAMTSAGIEVVVVGAKMAVPEQAALIVDGTIKAKGGTVTLSLRIRDPRDGSTLETLPPSSSPLVAIDKAAAEQSAKLVPAIQTQLQKLHQVKPEPKPDVVVVAPPQPQADPQLPELKVSVSMLKPNAALQLLQSAFPRELDVWGKHHGRRVDLTGASTLQFELITFSITPGKIPLAKARVRMRLYEAGKIKFDRVIRTDTIVGDRDISEQAFAERAAREVLLIAHANLRRTLTDWK
jgi:hypothetical protein